MKRTSRTVWLAFILLAGGSSSQAQVSSFAPDRKPSDPPAEVKRLLGEYTARDTTFTVLEHEGFLFLTEKGHPPLHLLKKTSAVYTTMTVGGQPTRSVVFEGPPAGRPVSLVTNGSRFLRRPFDGEDGKTFTITPLFTYTELVERAQRARPPKETGTFLPTDLVEIRSLDTTVHYDIRYATTNNFMKQKFYSQAKAFLQRPAAEALVRAHRWLEQFGYGLLIHDAYRPWIVTKMFWDATPKEMKDFVANPAKGSRHNRGCAVDVTLYNRTTGAPVEMVSGYDEFSERSYPAYAGGTDLQRWHRSLLREALEREGYTVYRWEWWHFDFSGWEQYRIGVLPFEEIR